MTPEQIAANRLASVFALARDSRTTESEIGVLMVEHLSDAGLVLLTAERAAALLEAEGALAKVRGWAEAYPPDVFPPVDLKAARERFGDDALFSRLHAEWARHIMSGVGRIVGAAQMTQSEIIEGTHA